MLNETVRGDDEPIVVRFAPADLAITGDDAAQVGQASPVEATPRRNIRVLGAVMVA